MTILSIIAWVGLAIGVLVMIGFIIVVIWTTYDWMSRGSQLG